MPYHCLFASGFCYAGSYRALFMPYGLVNKKNVQNAGQTFPEGHFSPSISGELACFQAFLQGLLAMLVTGRLGIEAPIVVLLTMLRAGAFQ